MKDINRYRGCLIGGAAGDALGYAVEFLQADQIFQKYGQRGITEYRLTNGVAQISDDTQMTLFTAAGLLLGTTRGMTRGIMGSYEDYIARCYSDWLKTQTRVSPNNSDDRYSWLINVPELHHCRAPGITCLSALRSGQPGTIENPINQSKGCGGVMRVAPIGLYLHGRLSSDEIDMLGARAAAITHGHELGYLPAAILVHIINLVAHDEKVALLSAVIDSLATVERLFPNARHMDELDRLIEKAIDFAQKDMNDVDAIHQLGGGWVAEETLAIAIYCSLKYQNDFDQAIIASVNHSGDSDSTGSVTGNILGVYLGLDAIPAKYIDHLEIKDIILEIADDLYHDCPINEGKDTADQKWLQKYVSCDYVPSKERAVELGKHS